MSQKYTGGRPYEHAEPALHGGKEVWTKENPKINDLRLKAYSEKLEVFKKQKLLGLGELKNIDSKVKFEKGDTLYPFLTGFYGMNNRTAFLVMTKMLQAGVNIDLWKPDDEILITKNGDMMIKRSGLPQQAELKNILQPKIARQEDEKPAPPPTKTPTVAPAAPTVTPKVETSTTATGDEKDDSEDLRKKAADTIGKIDESKITFDEKKLTQGELETYKRLQGNSEVWRDVLPIPGKTGLAYKFVRRPGGVNAFPVKLLEHGLMQISLIGTSSGKPFNRGLLDVSATVSKEKLHEFIKIRLRGI